MDEEISEYEKYLLSFGVVKKPVIPKFDVLAYTDNEYLYAIIDWQNATEFIDDEYLTIKHLKGE